MEAEKVIGAKNTAIKEAPPPAIGKNKNMRG